MNVFAIFDVILSMILQDIKETKRYGRTVGLSFGQTDNVKTVYPPTNIVCGWYNKMRDGTHSIYIYRENLDKHQTKIFPVALDPTNGFKMIEISIW